MMKRLLKPLLLLLALLLTLCACTPAEVETFIQIVDEVAQQVEQMEAEAPAEEPELWDAVQDTDISEEPVDTPAAPLEEEPPVEAAPVEEQPPVEDAPVVEEPAEDIPVDVPAEDIPADVSEPEIPADEPVEEIPEDLPAVIQGEDYYTPEDVALYLHLYRELPPNYLTKSEAEDWGWDSREGNLWEVFPGGCIGGDRFGNYEGLLPKGKWTECDVNFDGGYRGAERLVFNKDGAIYYTDDHYESFTQLYEGWAE